VFARLEMDHIPKPQRIRISLAAAWREWVFRTVSQIMINYRRGPISSGEAGDVHGGDRLRESRSILLRSKPLTRP
jgi:hypothetical protein